MYASLVMTVIGKDRPGLVEQVARLVAEHGGSWLESRMCRLGGEFAGILRITLPSEHQAALTNALRGLEAAGLTLVLRPDESTPLATPSRLATLEIVGQDRPGIVRQVAGALARRGVNVEELHTECVSAPMSGETLFQAQARLHLPSGVSLEELRGELDEIAADLLVELSLAPLPVEASEPPPNGHRKPGSPHGK